MEGDEAGRGRDTGVVTDRESANRALNLQKLIASVVAIRNMLP